MVGQIFDKVLWMLAALSAGILGAISVVIAINVALRNLGLPIIYGALDAIQYALMIATFMGAPWVLAMGASRIGPRYQSFGGDHCCSFGLVWHASGHCIRSARIDDPHILCYPGMVDVGICADLTDPVYDCFLAQNVSTRCAGPSGGRVVEKWIGHSFWF
jgi:hypothetical protein